MYIINLDSADRGTPGVGQKAAGLGFLKRSGFAVPPGFVVASAAFEKFLVDTCIDRELLGILDSVIPEEPRSAFDAYGKIKGLFGKVSGTDFLIREMKGAYNELSFGKDVSDAGGAALDFIRAGRAECFVSVRPSLICENSPALGLGKTSLNLIGYRQVLNGIKDCWLSVFSPESVLYRKIRGIEKFSLGVVVQKMVDSEISGVLFTSEPLSGDGSKALVEGCWNLGESISQGVVSPDQYLIGKETGTVSKKTGRKVWLRRRGPLSGTTIQEKVPLSRVSTDTLSESSLQKFAAVAKKLEEVFKGPQEAEWAVERGRIVLLQSRPLALPKPDSQTGGNNASQPFQGIGASPGNAKGKAFLASDFSAAKKPEPGAILVTKNLGMELLPYIKWFSGIVSEQGGLGSRMASIGRELGIPMVSGVENATVIFSPGQEVVMDGLSGTVRSA